MKYDLIPVGTMAHEFVCAIGGMYGPQMANHIAMNSWRNTFRGALGTYLYDSFGWDIFSLNFSEDFANLFKGLRDHIFLVRDELLEHLLLVVITKPDPAHMVRDPV